MRRVLWLPFLLSPSCLLAQPAITFEPQAAVASGLTPGAQVVWFSVARESSEGVGTIVRRERIDVADAQGDARFALDRSVPYKSIWVAVDLASGSSTAATSRGFPLREVTLPSAYLLPGGGALQTDAIQAGWDAVEALVVRTKAGAWGYSAGRGGTSDEGGGGGLLRFSLDRMHSLGAATAAPPRLDPADLLILIDPNEMILARGRANGGKP